MSIRLVVAVTDKDWFDHLRAQSSRLREVNFWAPGGASFKVLELGELFLFKLHAPLNLIVGGGVFAHANSMPCSLEWEAFGEANGATSLAEMRGRLINSTAESDGLALWNLIQDRAAMDTMSDLLASRDQSRYGAPVLVRPRLGQGTFRVIVTDAYNRRCAITGERTLPALEAAHIKPFSEGGSHEPKNGLLITIKPTERSSPSSTVSGTIEGSVLRLTGGVGSPPNLALVKSDEAEFHAHVSVLRDKGREINEERIRREAVSRQAKAHADHLAHLSDLTRKMTEFAAQVDAELGKFPPIEQRYRAITEWMNAALSRQRSIYGDGQAGVARSQITVAINQASIEAEQIHINVQSVYSDMDANLIRIVRDAAAATKDCQTSKAKSNGDSSLGTDDQGCATLLDTTKRFKQSVEALGRAFGQAETVWLEERRKQEGIIKAANIAYR